MNHAGSERKKIFQLIFYASALFIFSIAFSTYSLRHAFAWRYLVVSAAFTIGGLAIGRQIQAADQIEKKQGTIFSWEHRLLKIVTIVIVMGLAGYLVVRSCYPLTDGQVFRPWFATKLPMVCLLLLQGLDLWWTSALSRIIKERFEKSLLTRFLIWIAGLIVIGSLGYGILQHMFREEMEHDHGDGSVTIEKPNFLDPSRYYLYEKENFLVIRYLREADGPEDTDMSITLDEYLKQQAENESRLEAEWEAQKAGSQQQNTYETDPDPWEQEQQEMLAQIEEGYQKIYDTFLQDEASVWIKDYDARGNSYYIVAEDEEKILYLKYDRQDDNGTTARYVYFRNMKNPDGSWSPVEAEILTMYRYDFATKEAIDLEQTTW